MKGLYLMKSHGIYVLHPAAEIIDLILGVGGGEKFAEGSDTVHARLTLVQQMRCIIGISLARWYDWCQFIVLDLRGDRCLFWRLKNSCWP